MHRNLQFGMRENPASDQRHGSRQAGRCLSEGNCIQEENPTSSPPAPGKNQSFADVDTKLNAASPHAATGEKDSTATHPAVVIPHGSFERTAHSFEPLIGSDDAAKLLGNIHIKTLQRYARSGNLPGYQIGGHWYFRVSELDSWLRSRLNSSCHPCRLQEKSDGT